MLSPNHNIDIYIGGQLLDQPKEGIKLSINNVIFDPTELKNKQAEYSFEFQLPCTPTNNKVFDHANVLSKTNKFRNRYIAQVNCDGTLIFDGSLIISSVEDDNYNCNLVNIKIESLEDIFGDSVMSNIPWYVPFSGATTINSVNADTSKKYFFPFVSYGVFQKNPYLSDEVGNEYTSKFTIDKYNQFWYESFFPSPNVLELVKKAFEWKGYKVTGEAFRDPILSQIYASPNLSDSQAPNFNVGNPLIGSMKLNINFHNKVVKTRGFTNGRNVQELKFPYDRITGYTQTSGQIERCDVWNFDRIDWWNMLDTVSNSGCTWTAQTQTYMIDPNEHLVVIPASGWYKIKLEANVKLVDQGVRFTGGKVRTRDGYVYQGWLGNSQYQKNMYTNTPVEIQLLRNNEDSIELIKGKWNTYCPFGIYEAQPRTWKSCFPHEALGMSLTDQQKANITVTSSLTNNGVADEANSRSTDHMQRYPSRRTKGKDNSTATNQQGNGIGYMYRDGSTMAFDPLVSNSFICGLSSLSSGVPAVMKDGYSWSKMSSINNNVLANVDGYNNLLNIQNGIELVKRTSMNLNEYPDAPTNYANVELNSRLQGRVTCCVWLEKNDILELDLIQRHYDYSTTSAQDADRLDKQAYEVEGTASLEIDAVATTTKEQLRAENFGYLSPKQVDEELNICNFQNNEKKVSEWIDDVLKAFNLSMYSYGDTVEIATNMGVTNVKNQAVIDIDDRVNTADEKVTAERIDYPSELSVKYNINTDEWGFERSVDDLWINSDEWKQHGDSGYTVIKLNDDTYTTKKSSVSVPFSYTYYDEFLWKEVLSGGTETGTQANISIPVIELAQYMADGYGYDEAMKHDGYSLNQRFWFRKTPSSQYVHLADNSHEKVYLTYPINSYGDFNLSYKNTERSLLTDYFSCEPMLSSNFIEVETYISSDEYQLLRSGANVHFDSDLYMISEIENYSPNDGSATLKMIKK